MNATATRLWGNCAWQVLFLTWVSLALPSQAQSPGGTVLGWGQNQSVPPAGLSDVSAVGVGSADNLALRTDGTVVAWGARGTGTIWSNAVAVAIGSDWSFALITNGTVVAGNSSLPNGLTNVTALSVCSDYCLALRSNGTVVSWGIGWNGLDYLTSLPPPADLTNAVAISAGQAHGVALRRDGSVVAWGDNTYGQTNLPTTLTNVVALAAGQYHTVALNADGSLTVWGVAPNLPAGTNVVAVASCAYSYVGLMGDGTVSGWGVNAGVPAGLAGVMGIAAGGFDGVAVIDTNDFRFASRQTVGSTVFDGTTFFIRSAIADFPISSYQWRLNGTNITNATNRLLTLKNIPLSGAGNYSVIVSNLYGLTVSSNVVLCVTTSPPFVIMQPIPQTAVPGTKIALSVSAGGSLPINYQWRFTGTNIDGATNSILSFAPVLPQDRGYYDVILSNAYDTVVSSNVFLHVLDAGDALNATNLIWSFGGDASWFVENGTSYDATHDGLAIQSGAITAGQESSIQTTVTGPSTLTFWWNVSSWPLNYLDFSVNGLEKVRIWSDYYFSYGWEARTNYLGAGPQSLKWDFVKTDSRGSLNGYAWDSGWLDQVSYTPGGTAPFLTLNPTNQVLLLGANASLNGAAQGTPPLSYQWQLNQTNIDDATSTNFILTNVQFVAEGYYTLVISNAYGVTSSVPAFLNVVDFTEALNATNLAWISNGDQPWFPETTVTHDGVAALQSGAISGSQLSTDSTILSGPGTLSFWWKVSSETNNDYVNFTLDGLEQSRISGTVNWQQRTFYLTNGTHSLAWTYRKNATINGGSDAAWLDQVSYAPGGTAAFAASGPADQNAAISANATFTVSAGGTPLISHQWYFNSISIPSATNSSLTITNVQAASTGTYAVAVTNDYGGSVSTNANLYLLSVYAWGAGQSNTLTTPNYGQCIVPTNLLGVTAIAAGGYHSLALRANGIVVAWGYNFYHQTNVPSTLTNVTAVAAGLLHSLALRSDGIVTAWGNSSYSQTTVPPYASNVTAIAAGWYHCLALRSNGTVVAWGAGTSQGLLPNYGQSMVPIDLSNVTAIAAGGYHSLALRTNGTVVAWGWNAFGQTNVPVGLSNVIAIAACNSNSLALKNDGTLVAWGANASGQTNIPAGLSNVVAISAGVAHNMALRNDGSLVVWGLNGNGQTNIPAGLTNIMAVSAGAYHSMALINVGPVTFLSQPLRQSAYTASTVAFASSMIGAGQLSYQWLFNGTNIDGATNALLVLTNLPLSDAGSYWCIASNSFGAATNLIAKLTVLRSTPWFNPGVLTFTTNGLVWELDRLSGHGVAIIYASTNMVDWIPILTNPPQVGSFQFWDASVTNKSARFYRALEQ